MRQTFKPREHNSEANKLSPLAGSHSQHRCQPQHLVLLSGRLKRGQGLFDSNPNPGIDLCNKSLKAVLGGQKKSSAAFFPFTETSDSACLSTSSPSLPSVGDGGAMEDSKNRINQE